MNGSGRHAQWIEIDGIALRHNLQLIRTLLRTETQLLAVVKANAYGHGLEQVAPVAEEVADWFGVHTAEEARAIRRLGVTQPVLIMGFIPAHELYELDAQTHVLVSAPEELEWLAAYRGRTGVALPVHVKIDTGTKRQGVIIEQLPALLREAGRAGVDVIGAGTHFANIEDTLEHGFARQQLDQFARAMDVVRRELGEEPPLIHTACSAATLLFRETDFSLVRIGISMYGHWPSRETKLSWTLEHGQDGFQLRPVLAWKAVVGQIQDVDKGATVGYGRTWTALRDTRLAVIPVGYADGYSRVLGNRSRVLIHGTPVPVVGRVCMNIMMADITDLADVAVGDEVVLLGRQGGVDLSAEELARLSGTINYEFLARISPFIPRIMVSGPDELHGAE
jgi:alanine racemase